MEKSSHHKKVTNILLRVSPRLDYERPLQMNTLGREFRELIYTMKGHKELRRQYKNRVDLNHETLDIIKVEIDISKNHK